jgi:hypothetical protein
MTIWSMCIARWIPTDKHSEYVKLIAFALQQWLQKEPQCYVIRTLPVFLFFVFAFFFENRAVYEIVWRDVVVPYKPTDSSIILQLNLACCISKSTETHSEYVMLFFRGNNGHANSPQCYVIRTLPALLFSLNISNPFVRALVCGLKTVFRFHQHPDLAAVVRSAPRTLTAVTHLLITKYILKLAGICSFCNVNICT